MIASKTCQNLPTSEGGDSRTNLTKKKYPQLVTNIPHALHMPGHIYSQTGRWADAAKSFNEAAINEPMWMKLDKLYGNAHHGHNVHYLATAYSFEGRYDDAVEAPKSRARETWILASPACEP